MRACTDVNQAVQKGAGGDEHGPGPVGQSQGLHHPHHPAVLDQEPLHHGLAQLDQRLMLQAGLHGQAIGLLVALDPGAAHRRPFGEVQGAELDAGEVRQFPHGPAQGVDLFDHVALGQAAHRRVAGHLGHGVEIEVEEEHLEAHAGRGQGPFAAGVARPDDDQIVFFRIKGHVGNFGLELRLRDDYAKSSSNSR